MFTLYLWSLFGSVCFGCSITVFLFFFFLSQAAAMAKAVAGSGAAALDNLGLQGGVWRNRRLRRLQEKNGDGNIDFNYTVGDFDNYPARSSSSTRDRTHSESRALQAGSQQPQQQWRLLAGRDDSWGMSLVPSSPSQPDSSRVSGSRSSSWSSTSGSDAHNQKNKKGRPLFRRNIGGGVHVGAAVQDGWALEEHDRGGRGSHRPVPMVLGDDDDAGGAHSSHSGGGGLRGHVER